MEPLFNAVIAFITEHQAWALPIAFLVSFGESFAVLSLLVPGTTILAACGALIPSGALPLWPLLIGAVSGAVLGDTISYWLGRRYGHAIVAAWPLRNCPGMVAKAEAMIQRYGVAGVAIGRFFGPVRAVVPLVAGIAAMDRRLFWLANILSALVWAPALLLPGAALGWLAARIDPSDRWLVGAALLVAVTAGVALYRRTRARSDAR